jgi:hypothetical protein
MFALERRHLPHLTGFRAIAAYLVLIGHSADTTFLYGMYGGSSIANAYVSCLAYLGMSIFFVLSGFVITYTYYDRFIQLPWRQAAWNFAVARFARLYPLYILFLLCATAHQRHQILHDGTRGEKVSFFTLTQSWWNMEMFTFPPAWSISTECFFYICFALWMMLPTAPRCSATYVRRRAIMTLTGIFLILAAMFTARAGIAILLSPLSRPTCPNVWAWFTYFSPYVRIGEFIAGVCAARMFMVTRNEGHLPAHQQHANWLCIGSGVAIIAFIIINICFAHDSFLYLLSQNFGYAPFLAYIFYACSRYPNILTKWCSTGLMQTGGEISYSVYILQFWTYSHVIPEPVAEWPSHLAYEVSLLKVLLYILLTTIIALCSYHIVEMPCRRLIRKWL